MDNQAFDLNSNSDISGDGSKNGPKSSFLSYLLVIARNRKFIIGSFFVVTFTVAILSLFLPNWYTAKTTILPPEKEGFLVGVSGGSGVSSIIGEMALPLMATPSDVLASILNSRRVAQAVIDTEDLQGYYGLNTKEKTLKEVWSHLKVWVGEEGIVNLTYEDKNRDKAAGIANSFIGKLDEVNRQTQISKAKNKRVFLEERLTQTEEKLKEAEENLKKFKESKKVASLDEQTKSTIESAADLKANLDSIEVELYVATKTSPASPFTLELRLRREELTRKLKQADSTLVQMASMSLDFTLLYRDVALHNRVFDLLTQELERAKIEEAKDTPSLQILDQAVPPEKKSRPKRTYLVAFAGFLTLLSSIFWVFLREFLSNFKRQNPQEFNQLQNVYQGVSGDITQFRRSLLKFKKTKI